MKDIFKYVLDNFTLFYDCDTSLISYAKNPDKIHIVQAMPAGFFNGEKDIDVENIVWKTWKGQSLPFLFDKDGTGDIISDHKGHVTVNVDIIASAFYFLSGWNERFAEKDDLGRVNYKDSMIAKLGLITLPVVNYYFDILKTAIEKVTSISKRAGWGEKDLAVVLTHDIDTCQTGWLEDSFYALKKGKILSVLKLIIIRLFGKDIWFNLNDISGIEQQCDANSSFYFLPEKGRRGKQKNADYNISTNKIKKAVQALADKGHDIGVHGSFGTHVRPDEFKTGIEKVPVPIVKGNRFHYLMWDNDHSVSVLEDNGIRYDTTLGFSEHIGFRRGTCYPFFLYDFKNERTSAVLELPMNVMDVSLKQPRYMGLNQQDVMPAVKELFAEVSKFGGVLTILWHNNYFSPYKYTGWKNIYNEILAYAKESNAQLSDGYTVYEQIIG